VAGKNGGVSRTIRTSRGWLVNQRRRSGTTASMTTSWSTNAPHITQSRISATPSQGRPTFDSWTTMTGMASSAARSRGTSNHLAIRSLRDVAPVVGSSPRPIVIP